MNSEHLNITDHAVDRYRDRVIGKNGIETNKDIRRRIIKEVKNKFIVLGDGVYPIQNTKCAYVIKNSTIVTVIPASKIHHDIICNQTGVNRYVKRRN